MEAKTLRYLQVVHTQYSAQQAQAEAERAAQEAARRAKIQQQWAVVLKNIRTEFPPELQGLLNFYEAPTVGPEDTHTAVLMLDFGDQIVLRFFIHKVRVNTWAVEPKYFAPYYVDAGVNYAEVLDDWDFAKEYTLLDAALSAIYQIYEELEAARAAHT